MYAGRERDRVPKGAAQGSLVLQRGPLSGTVLSLRTILRRNVKRFPGGLVFKAHRLLYHSTLGLRLIKKKKKTTGTSARCAEPTLTHAPDGLLIYSRYRS